jgi:hypothetical protein
MVKIFIKKIIFLVVFVILFCLFLWIGCSKEQIKYYDLETIRTNRYPRFEIEMPPSIEGPYHAFVGSNVFDKGQYISCAFTSSDKKTIIRVNCDYDMTKVTIIVFVENKKGEISCAVLKGNF